MLCSVVFLMGLVILSRNGIFSFRGADVCNRVTCTVEAINCLFDVPPVHQNLLFNYEYEAGCTKDQFLISYDT